MCVCLSVCPSVCLVQVPDVVAMAYDEYKSTLSVVYSDHSLLNWDVTDVCQVSYSIKLIVCLYVCLSICLVQVPDVVAMAYDEYKSTLSVVYSDHSLLNWDVTDVCQLS